MSKRKKTALIYKIINLSNGKVYVGSTSDYRRRKCNHVYNLKNNIHPNAHLQNSYNKYGKEVFKFEVLELCSESELIILEQKYLDAHKCYDNKFGYNISKIAGRSVGVVCTEEKKKKISLANKERYKNGFSEEHLQK